MKTFFYSLLFGIICGIVFQIELGNKVYPGEKTDTVYVKRDSITVNDSLIEVLPKELTVSFDSVNIDTVSTVINGKIIESKYKIRFK